MGTKIKAPKHAFDINRNAAIVGPTMSGVVAVSNFWHTTHNNTQQHAITCKRVCKRTHHVTANNVASVCKGLNVSNGIKVNVKGPKYYFQISRFC